MDELNPTKARLDVARAIDRGEVYSYEWTGQCWWQHGVDRRTVTRQANDLLQHGLAREVPGPHEGDRSWLELTDAGREWLKLNGGTA